MEDITVEDTTLKMKRILFRGKHMAIVFDNEKYTTYLENRNKIKLSLVRKEDSDYSSKLAWVTDALSDVIHNLYHPISQNKYTKITVDDELKKMLYR